jgi:hypothetical protein
MVRYLPLILCGLALAGCGKNDAAPQQVETDPFSSLIEQANEQTMFHQVAINLTTPLTSGRVLIYRLLDSDVAFLESRRFDQPNPSLNVGYNAPLSTDESAVLLHIVTAGLTQGRPDEFVCAVAVNHSTTRHNYDLACDHASTVTYYLAGTAVGRSGLHPFHDIEQRLPLWMAFVDSLDNDVIGFYASIFGTLQNALAGMGQSRFSPDRHSIRPVMETIVAQFVDLYQRNGQASSSDLIAIAEAVTDHSLPLARLARFQTIFDGYAHIEDNELRNTGGSLTQKDRQLELLSMSSELARFYLRESPYEMSDYRTHIVQNVRHESNDTGVYVRWDPIPHMYGYNTYLDSQHIGYSRLPTLTLEPGTLGTVTIKAVGYAGEFDGVHHDLAEPSLLAGVSSDAP